MDELSERIASLSPEQRTLLIQRLQKRRKEISSPDHAPTYDAVILGGGLAGLTLALQLKRALPSIRLLVAERQHHPVPEAAFKVGESTVEISARYFRDVLGLHEHLQSDQLRKGGMRFFFSGGDNQDITRRVEYGLSAFLPIRSYQLDRGRLENFLSDELRRLDVTFLDGCKVRQIELGSGMHAVKLLHADQEQRVLARWVIDASGRNCILKKKLGLEKDEDHDVNAVWFRIAGRVDIDTWSADAEWRLRATPGFRRLSTIHLSGAGYWVWIIPLASESTSIGIVADTALHPFDTINRFDRALEWLKAYEPQCARVVEDNHDRLLDFRVMKHYAHGCTRLFSDSRWAIVGEAGIFTDPLYSPGSDFIAIANSFVTDLMARDLRGEDVRTRAEIYNRIFLNIAEQWFHIYRHQYQLLGNAQIMTAKLIWDFALYWGSYGLLCFHNKLCDLAFMSSIAADLQRLIEISKRMQAFFREWSAFDQQAWGDLFIDYGTIPFLRELHSGMAAQLDDESVRVQFARNMDLFAALGARMLQRAIERSRSNPAPPTQIARWLAEPLFSQASASAVARTATLDQVWACFDEPVVERNYV